MTLLVNTLTGDIKAHQVLLNRLPEQATEDRVRYQILLRINFRVEITIFTQCDIPSYVWAKPNPKAYLYSNQYR